MAIALSASGCTEFTRSSMADVRLAGSICSQLNIELAHRGVTTSGRKCDSLHILYDGCIVAQRQMFTLTSCPVFAMFFTIKLSDCPAVKANNII